MSEGFQASTPMEVPQKTKAELFAEDPDRFEDIHSVLLIVKRDPEKGVMVMNRCLRREDLRDVQFEVNLAVLQRHGELLAAAAQQGIVKPGANGHGFMNGIRNIGRKR